MICPFIVFVPALNKHAIVDDWFDFDKTFICCENYITGKTHYYDYQEMGIAEEDIDLDRYIIKKQLI